MPQDTGGILNLKKPVGSDDIRLQTIGIDLPYNFQKIDDAFTAHQAESVTQGNPHGIDAKANKGQEPWITGTLMSGWVGSGAGFQYAKNDMGLVILRMNATAGGTLAGGTIATLPVGYRPSVRFNFSLTRISDNAVTGLDLVISPDGSIKIPANSSITEGTHYQGLTSFYAGE